jgi:DnaK suppressor protein
MNQKTVLQLKTELLTKKQSLINMQALNNKVEVDQEPSKDILDRSDVEEAMFTKERMSHHWKQELAHIQMALQKIEDGSFGECEECEEEIPVKRLRVRPDASLCLDCQEVAERELGPNQRLGGRPMSQNSSASFDILQ